MDDLDNVYVMDLAKSNDVEAPIYYWDHDGDIILAADSFFEFLTFAVEGKGIYEKVYGKEAFDLAVKEIQQMNKSE